MDSTNDPYHLFTTRNHFDGVADLNHYPSVSTSTYNCRDTDERPRGGQRAALPATLRNFKPTFKTLVPPLHFAVDEMYWMHPSRKNFHELILIPEPEKPKLDERQLELSQIFLLAFDDPLPFALRQVLMSEIENEPELIHCFELKPEKLEGLVTHNPQVAITVLLGFMERRNIKELLDVLVEMELSINTMEVVNRLANTLIARTQEAALPRPFLYQFIANCVTRCESEKLNDRIQSRHARLFCVFLQSLFRNHIIEIQLMPAGLIFQIESFCIEFSRIREATALYQYLKELESAELALEAIYSQSLHVEISENHNLETYPRGDVVEEKNDTSIPSEGN